MATFEDVSHIAERLGGVTRGVRYGNGTWQVGKKAFAWERPFTKADLKRLGTVAAPSGPILAVSVADLEDKDVVLAQGHPGVFTISHFDGYAAVLIELDTMNPTVLEDLLLDAWMTCTPTRPQDQRD